MKKLLLFSMLILSTLLFSQEIDQRLLVKYNSSEIKKIQKDNPNEYLFLINALNKGIFIGDIPQEKSKSIVFDGEITVDLTQTHTFLTLGLEIKDKYQYYKIKGTNKMLGVLPRIALDEKLLKEKTQSTKK
ncbi:MAG: hypothetical protein HYU67_06185 [Flavobacteriia bacterium]|nr:hypothetical protein [Flavobacteriia bacterium]